MSDLAKARETYESAVSAWHAADNGPCSQASVDASRREVEEAWDALVRALAADFDLRIRKEISHYASRLAVKTLEASLRSATP